MYRECDGEVAVRLSVIAVLGALALASPALADQASAVQAVKGQPRIIDALVDNSGNLFASVKPDNKIPWDKFAEHLCIVVRPHQARIFVVRVVDVTAVNFAKRPTEWKRLAEARCAK